MTYRSVDAQHRMRPDVEIFGNGNRHHDDFAKKAMYAMLRFGRVRGNRLDAFVFTNEHGTYDAAGLITSAPILGRGIRATGDVMAAPCWRKLSPHVQTNQIHDVSMLVEALAGELRGQLRSKTFEAGHPHHLDIPKVEIDTKLDPVAVIGSPPDAVLVPTLKTRTLTIADLPQRAIGKAISSVLLQLMRSRFSSCVVGSVPCIGIADIIKGVQAAISATRYTWVLTFDLSKFYNNVRLDRVLTAARHRIGYNANSDLGWLIEVAGLGLRGDHSRTGLPQGNPLSSLLANIAGEEAIDTIATHYGPFLRYVDDGLLLCPNRETAEHAYAQLCTRATAFGLELHPDKTSIVDLRHDHITYLGLDLHIGDALHLDVALPDAALLRLYHRLGSADHVPIPSEKPIDALVRSLIQRHLIIRGWLYAYGAATWTPRQEATVQAYLAYFGLGGIRLRDPFAAAWRDCVPADKRSDYVEAIGRQLTGNGIRHSLTIDGVLDVAIPDVAAWRKRSASLWELTPPHALRWFLHSHGRPVVQWTAPRAKPNKSAMSTRVNTGELEERFADALPATPGDITFSAGPGSSGNGDIPGTALF